MLEVAGRKLHLERLVIEKGQFGDKGAKASSRVEVRGGAEQLQGALKASSRVEVRGGAEQLQGALKASSRVEVRGGAEG